MWSTVHRFKEATVTPLVLGLGIDYAIHLQRSQRTFKDEFPTVSESWLRACGHLSMPLIGGGLTVAAFMAIISTFAALATGYALSLGIVSAFIFLHGLCGGAAASCFPNRPRSLTGPHFVPPYDQPNRSCSTKAASRCYHNRTVLICLAWPFTGLPRLKRILIWPISSTRTWTSWALGMN